MKMKKEITTRLRCKDCGAIIHKWEGKYCKGRCPDCDYTIMINVRTGKVWNVKSGHLGNPIKTIDGKEVMLKPSLYLVTSKYSDTFYLTEDNPENFKENEIFSASYDFSVKILEKALKLFKELKKKKVRMKHDR